MANGAEEVDCGCVRIGEQKEGVGPGGLLELNRGLEAHVNGLQVRRRSGRETARAPQGVGSQSGEGPSVPQLGQRFLRRGGGRPGSRRHRLQRLRDDQRVQGEHPGRRRRRIQGPTGLCVSNILVEGFSSTEAAAEGSALAVWKFQEYKDKVNRSTTSKVELYEDPDRENWERGIRKAEAQNIARKLEETPANLMTPSVFAQKAIEILCPCGVQVEVRDKDWMEQKRMTAFLSMARGSCEPPLFLELAYCGGNQDDKPVVLTGKGVTFDSGGLCLLPCKGMGEKRADMAGAAVLVASFKGVATINVPLNCNGLIPLCENMPGGMAMKPGDVVVGLSGKTIRLEDTSKEGRVILSDALAYSCHFKPCLVMNVATLTSGMRVALGSACTGAFSTSDVVWQELSQAGAETGDRAWRLPLWKHYQKKISHNSTADVNNVGAGRGGDPCIGAAFLVEFGPQVDFLHLDIAGTGQLSSDMDPPYIRPGTMSGRPTRTLIQFLYQMACPNYKGV